MRYIERHDSDTQGAMQTRITRLLVIGLAVAGCGGTAKPAPSTPAPTATSSATPSSLVGDFAIQNDGHTAVLRFAADGTCAVAKSVEGLATPSHRCTWTLDGSRLTFNNTEGSCAEKEETKIGVFDVIVTAQDVSFKKVSDSCERRMAIDGETWTRITK